MWPPTSPSQAQGSHSTEYYYFIVGVAVIAVILLVANVFASRCISSCRLVQAVKRLLCSQGILARLPQDDQISQLIPACKYEKEQAAWGNECSVCLTVLEEGDNVRQLPQCKHSFHAPCIDMWLYSHVNCPLCRANVLPLPQRSPKAEARHETLLESRTMIGVLGLL